MHFVHLWFHVRLMQTKKILSSCVRLLKRNRVPAADTAAAHDFRVYSDVGGELAKTFDGYPWSMSGCRLKDARIFRQIALGQGSHHASRTRADNAQPDLRADCKRPADPVQLYKSLPARGRRYDEIRPIAARFEAAPGIEFL